jgi:uncharacterized Zn finger protein
MATEPKIPPGEGDPQTVEVACPHCAAHLTKPLRVTTRKGDPGHVDVTMSCTDCGHTWIVQKITTDITTPPQ